jgi:hypothetical protein
MTNLKTTVAGVLASLLAALTLLQKFLNNEPITLEEITMLGAIGASGGGLVFARDAKAADPPAVAPPTAAPGA